VHLSREKVGEAVGPYRKRDGLQDGFSFRLEPTRRIHVHLEADLELLPGMKATERSTIRFDENLFFQCVRLDESGFDRALLTFVLAEYMADFWAKNKDRHYELLEEIGIVFVTPDVAIFKSREELTGGIDANGKPREPARRLQAYVCVKTESGWRFAASFSRTIEE